MSASPASNSLPRADFPVGVLLTNVGTPDAPTPAALRSYLAEFLSDPRIVELPGWLWLPILHGMVLRTRPRHSARLYRSIWTDEGSPMLVTGRSLAQGVRRALEASTGAAVHVTLGMRYGHPSIAEGIEELLQVGVDRILVFPLFPQYSATTSGASLDAVFDDFVRRRVVPEVRTVSDYHDRPAYLDAVAESVRQRWAEVGRPDRLLISFHGIPERYALAGDPYAEQCRISARRIAERLAMADASWGISFQSRLGPVKWLTPYTDVQLAAWAEQGVERVHVVAPGFSTDCLETLYELDREGREAFLQAGGTSFEYIPALNDRPEHIRLLTDIILEHLPGWIPERHPYGGTARTGIGR